MANTPYNSTIEYFRDYGQPMEIEGTGVIGKADMMRYKELHRDLTLSRICFCNGITEIQAGYIEEFKNLKTLCIGYTVKDIEITDELLGLLVGNGVNIKGWYDSFGERFAKRYSLKFSHADIYIGWYCNDDYDMRSKLTIRFDDNGKPYREYDEYTSGISAGSNGGGVYTRELDEDFYVGMTLNDMAEFLPRYREPILKNKELEYYLRTANLRHKK